jgi:hypothetical protein
MLLLADPPNRTVANRERFMRLVAGSGEGRFEMGPEDKVSKVGQNRIYTPYMTVCMVISLPKIPYVRFIVYTL